MNKRLFYRVDKQKGSIVLIAVGVIFFLLTVAGGTYYFVQKKTKEDINQQTTSVMPTSTFSETNQKESNLLPTQTSSRQEVGELVSWQEYKNDTYFYKVKYPADWFFVKTGYSPPPPTTVLFSNIEGGYRPGVEYTAVEISVDKALGRNLDNYEEIQSYKSEYYEETRLMISGEQAAMLAPPDPASRTNIAVYLFHKEYMYKIGWTGYPQQEEAFKKILATFTFL